jgi:hypothetical protein
MNRAAAYI